MFLFPNTEVGNLLKSREGISRSPCWKMILWGSRVRSSVQTGLQLIIRHVKTIFLKFWLWHVETKATLQLGEDSYSTQLHHDPLSGSNQNLRHCWGTRGDNYTFYNLPTVLLVHQFTGRLRVRRRVRFLIYSSRHFRGVNTRTSL